MTRNKKLLDQIARKLQLMEDNQRGKEIMFLDLENTRQTLTLIERRPQLIQ